MGARRFLLLNVPPLDRPYRPDQSGVEALHADVLSFNRKLAELREDFTKYHHDAVVFLFDVHSLFETVVADPRSTLQTSRLSYTKGPCPLYDLGIGFEGTPDLDRYDPKCGVPVSRYLWHDSIHPTYPMHEAIAAKVVEDCMTPGTSNGFCS